MKVLTVLAILTAGSAAADSDILRVFTGHHMFAAYAHGVAAGTQARVVGFRSLDHNRNGYWEPEEYQPVFGTQSLDLRLTFDGNGDSRISKRELLAYDDGAGGPDGLLMDRR